MDAQKKKALGLTQAKALAIGAAIAVSGVAFAAPNATGHAKSAEHQRIVNHWTADRLAAAQPRDLRIDAQGRGYLRTANGVLTPYGKNAGSNQLKAARLPSQKVPAGKPSAGDSTPPSIAAMSPADGTTIGGAADFSAVITDPSGIKSVSFVVTYPNGTNSQSFSPSFIGNDTWSISLSGFSDGNWSWHVEATDNGSKRGNKAISAESTFTVDTGGGNTGDGGNNGGYIVSNAGWSAGGAVQTAAGRIYFEMPSNGARKRWAGYVCSGTVVDDATPGRSIIITAAHCAYDDANKSFARNVLFIPNQDGTTGSGTDSNCSNDPLGCWTPTFALVDVNWTTRSFPDNVTWDYAYYVVNDTGSHTGTAASSDVLDLAADTLGVSFSTPAHDDGDPSGTSIDFTHALGYSYSDDPNFMYCAEDMTTESPVNWWLPSCGLSGGASGGPWVQPMDAGTGSGPLMSVNSWGYTTGPGMAGPRLDNTTAWCLFGQAQSLDFASIPTTDGDAGVAVNYCQ